jgi:hypothetical protein
VVIFSCISCKPMFSNYVMGGTSEPLFFAVGYFFSLILYLVALSQTIGGQPKFIDNFIFPLGGILVVEPLAIYILANTTLPTS